MIFFVGVREAYGERGEKERKRETMCTLSLSLSFVRLIMCFWLIDSLVDLERGSRR